MPICCQIDDWSSINLWYENRQLQLVFFFLNDEAGKGRATVLTTTTALMFVVLMGNPRSPSSRILSMTLRRSSASPPTTTSPGTLCRASHSVMILSNKSSRRRCALCSRNLTPLTESTNRSDGKRSETQKP